MPDDDLLRQARDELYVLRAAIAPLRNRAKVAVAAIDDAQSRMDALIDQIDARLNGSPRPKGASGNGNEAEDRHQRIAR